MDLICSLLGIKGTDQTGLFTQEKTIAKESECHLGYCLLCKKITAIWHFFSLSKVSVEEEVFYSMCPWLKDTFIIQKMEETQSDVSEW